MMAVICIHMDNGGKGLDTLRASGWFIMCGYDVFSLQTVLTTPHTSVYDHGTTCTQQLDSKWRVWICYKA